MAYILLHADYTLSPIGSLFTDLQSSSSAQSTSKGLTKPFRTPAGAFVTLQGDLG